MSKKELKLVSCVPPSVNHYLAYRAIMKNGHPMATSYCTKEAKEYKENFSKYVADQVYLQHWDLEPNKYQHFYVDVTVYFPRVDMDANNYWKCMLDAITDTGLIWLDDNVVCERTNRIYYDSDNPRFEITISPTGYIGVFDDYEEYKQFELRCSGCTKNSKNCSVKDNALKGRIQDCIKDKFCTKYKEIKEK